MCPTIGLLGGIGTDHEGFHPSLIVAASPDLFLDGKPVAWPGDPLASTTTPRPCSLSGGGIGPGFFDTGLPVGDPSSAVW